MMTLDDMRALHEAPTPITQAAQLLAAPPIAPPGKAAPVDKTAPIEEAETTLKFLDRALSALDDVNELFKNLAQLKTIPPVIANELQADWLLIRDLLQDYDSWLEQVTASELASSKGCCS